MQKFTNSRLLSFCDWLISLQDYEKRGSTHRTCQFPLHLFEITLTSLENMNYMLKLLIKCFVISTGLETYHMHYLIFKQILLHNKWLCKRFKNKR